MATFTSFLFSSSSLARPPLVPSTARSSPSPAISSVRLFPLRASSASPRKLRLFPLRATSDSSSFDDLTSRPTHRTSDGSSKRSGLLNLIQDIEPFDVSLIQKDVPPTTIDAMKRTISGMLGLLPSDQFQVSIDALWESLSKLLVSSMMTGYTLRNAEYRLCLERNLDIHEGNIEELTPEHLNLDMQNILLKSAKAIDLPGNDELSSKFGNASEDLKDIGIEGLGELPTEAQQYILQLQSRLSSIRKELHEVKRKSAALQMQQFVGEEKNDLLDYLRSLKPEKVAELSESTSPELRDTINSIVHGLLATLSPKMQSKSPPLSESSSTGSIGNEDCAELVENTSLQFQPHISLTRDYLARLLFWCMLLGHYLRGLEYRLGLMELLSLTGNVENDVVGGNQAAAP